MYDVWQMSTARMGRKIATFKTKAEATKYAAAKREEDRRRVKAGRIRSESKPKYKIVKAAL